MQPNGNSLVKRFVAPSMRRALDLVREELGPEAVILSSQKTSEGVEVITSLEPDLPTRGIDVRREFGRSFDTELDTAMGSDAAWQAQAEMDKAAAQYAGRVEHNDRTSPEAGKPATRGERLALDIERARERMIDAKRRARENELPISELPSTASIAARQQDARDSSKKSPASQVSAMEQYTQSPVPAKAAMRGGYEQPAGVNDNSGQDTRLETLQSELADMRMILEQQLWRMSQHQAHENMPSQVQLPAGFSVVTEHLTRLGLPEKHTHQLLSETKHHKKVNKAWRECMARLAKDIPTATDDFVSKGGAYAFVGQTGVGKTTTIAKLAARYVLENGPGKVALVTTDTYRVGAHDQLRSLGRILNVPVRAVDRDNSLITVLSSLRQFSLVLIDTAGFRHGDPLLKDQLRQMDHCSGIKRVLVMACNSQLQTMKASTHAYSASKGIDACVLTKLDEAASLGEAISVVIDRQLPVAYTTNGQEIPKDIRCASGHQLVADAVALLKAPIETDPALQGG